jgi:uncharacterized protein YjiS (DUF1127 family)
MRSRFHAPTVAGLTGRTRPQPNVLRAVSNWMARHRSRRALARLDPHLLRDIGLTDHQLAQELSKPFWRD